MVSQKCQYAIRAIFELANRGDDRPVKIGRIAKIQAIPRRFLEVILNQLKHGGFVESRRGAEGGYFLIRTPRGLTVGDIIRFVEGPIGPIDCCSEPAVNQCPLYGDCVFLPMWQKARKAMLAVYDNTTFADLVEQAQNKDQCRTQNYCI